VVMGAIFAENERENPEVETYTKEKRFEEE
jgi:hypothetical protein